MDKILTMTMNHPALYFGDTGAKGKLSSFFHGFRQVLVPARQMLILGGEEPRGIYYLEQGHIRQYDISAKSGNEVTVNMYSPGSFFPLSWALNRSPNRHFYQTVDACRLWVAPANDVAMFLRREPTVLYALTQRLLLGLEGLSNRLPFYVFADSFPRVLAELVYLGKHFGTQQNGHIVITRQFTHQDLADLTGSVRETVSVAIERLKAERLISYRGKNIIINDVAKARAVLQSHL